MYLEHAESVYYFVRLVTLKILLFQFVSFFAIQVRLLVFLYGFENFDMNFGQEKISKRK